MASTTTTTATTTGPRGFRLQRHLDAAFTAPVHFGVEHVRRAKISTGITMEFAIHSRAETTSSSPAAQPVRVLLVMGFLNTKETWTPTIETMLRQWGETHPRGQDARLEVLTFDNRGVGGSTSPIGPYTTQQMALDAFALLDHIGWVGAHIIGYRCGEQNDS
jgi:pimeloyl-ACP methyl ester carboxylesterase